MSMRKTTADRRIIERIANSRLSPAERLEAMAALEKANAIVDGMLWIAAKLVQIGRWLAPRPIYRN